MTRFFFRICDISDLFETEPLVKVAAEHVGRKLCDPKILADRFITKLRNSGTVKNVLDFGKFLNECGIESE